LENDIFHFFCISNHQVVVWLVGLAGW